MSVDSFDNNRHTPLHRAAKCGHLKVAEFLIGQKSNLDLKAKNGCTAMLLAAECGHKSMVELLLRSGANGNCSSEIGNWTVLHHASHRGWTETVKLLVKNRNIKLDATTTLGATSLLLAAYEGHTSVIEHLIQAGAKVNFSDADLWTVLHYASKRGWLHIVKKIVEKKECDIDAKANGGMVPLVLAAYEGHKDIVELLIEAGADVTCSDIYWGNVLHYASKKGWLQIVKNILINKTEDILNSKNSQGNTPLHLAYGMHNTDIINELLNAGADSSIKNNKAEIAFMCKTIHDAAKSGDLERLEHLIQLGVSIESRDHGGYTPLDCAALSGNVKAAKFLIDNNCNLNPKGVDIETPLLTAGFRDHKEFVDLLIRSGADVTGSCKYTKLTILHLACQNGWKDTVKCILERDNVDVDAEAGLTPLLYAVKKGYVDIAKLLLQAGANIHACNNEGQSALHFVCREKDLDVEMVNMLLEHLTQLGVSIESRDHAGYTPLDCAALSGNVTAAKFLIDQNCNLNPKSVDIETPLLTAAFRGHKEFVDLLVRSGADVTGSCKYTKSTILHLACLIGWKDIVKCILERDNVDVNAATSSGLTPLLYAVKKGSVDVTKLLLQAGANIHACNNEGESALHFACREKYVDVEMVRMLLLAGADANLLNHVNQTAFHLAVTQGEPCLEVVKLLIEHGAYFTFTDYNKISNNNLLKELVLKDVDLCTQLLINKFNHQSLPEVYKKLEYIEKLPRISTLNIWNSQGGVGGGIAECVESEIETKTFCDVMKVRPMVLTLMCVQALINPRKTKKKRKRPTRQGPVKRSDPQKTKKERPTNQGPVKRSARLALLNVEGSAKKKC